MWQDEKGQRYKWFNNGKKWDVKTGQTMDFRATIKRYETHKDDLYVVLTRAFLMRVYEDEPSMNAVLGREDIKPAKRDRSLRYHHYVDGKSRCGKPLAHLILRRDIEDVTCKNCLRSYHREHRKYEPVSGKTGDGSTNQGLEKQSPSPGKQQQSRERAVPCNQCSFMGYDQKGVDTHTHALHLTKKQLKQKIKQRRTVPCKECTFKGYDQKGVDQHARAVHKS